MIQGSCYCVEIIITCNNVHKYYVRVITEGVQKPRSSEFHPADLDTGDHKGMLLKCAVYAHVCVYMYTCVHVLLQTELHLLLKPQHRNV